MTSIGSVSHPFAFQSISIAREEATLENPRESDPRVALVPEDVGQLVSSGLQVSVEKGAGLGIGFTDGQYLAKGALVKPRSSIYQQSADLIIKLKGFSLPAIREMQPQSTVMCMAHIETFPERTQLMRNQGLSVIAMEEIKAFPCVLSNQQVLSLAAMTEAIRTATTKLNVLEDQLSIKIIGYTEDIQEAIRRAARSNAHDIEIITDPERLTISERPTLVFYSSSLTPQVSVETAPNFLLFDYHEVLRNDSQKILDDYHSHVCKLSTPIFGKRRIECLHETGLSGAGYGLQLLENVSNINASTAKVIILGYGNVGMGAIQKCHDLGVKSLYILGRKHFEEAKVKPFLQQADLIINGVDLPADLKGKKYLVSEHDIGTVVRPGTVIVDLVGGSATERSAIESIRDCTFPEDPHFHNKGVYFTAVWGWPTMTPEISRTTAIKYSQQLRNILLEKQGVLAGVNKASPGIKRAWVMRSE